jgi:4-alpha-glucanotransferase
MDSSETPTVTSHRESSRKPSDPWGIDSGYQDANGKWRSVGPEVKRQLKAAMGTEGKIKPAEPGLRIVNQGDTVILDREADLTLEDGTVLRIQNNLPPDLPLGYHTLRPLRSRNADIRLIVVPPKCFLPENFHVWGWALQLYSLRSSTSWGIGDFADLRRFCQWTGAEHGARIIMTNPLNAAAPVVPQQASPYSPTSRIYRNPLYLRIDEVDGAREHLHNLEAFTKRGENLNRKALIDRDAIYQLKVEALTALWPHVRERVDFKSYKMQEGRQLTDFATYCALAERYGANWREWPDEYRTPGSPGIAHFAEEHGDRIQFHKWIQFLLDRQLADVCTQPMIMQDLPIGVDPAGADAWAWQHIFAPDVSVGAPPDLFNTQGQDWGLQPFVPYKLRAACYEPFIRILRGAMRHSAGLRIDHVMGLFRLFWIPNGAEKKRGTYVRYRADELLAILAL